ncbi:YbgC/FadM family acyl-CoA thioesterase [Helicobacter sp.]|uniref:YbgC/FadM family acyl-CoA thioesterase n=1 Tax=Helicobacter sp. TaxID=218 RepID=UPI0025B977A1|nr:YbgC/FadM family acyl-CoA thioesterase [Helicobacter sp.]MBR2495567.1 YbgC/FadM family acyl-CoA thioesterase [Helicobacter sp.]
MQVRIYYEDTDCGGIVYHTNYIKYCERARSELFFSHNTLPSLDTCGFVVSAIDAKFLGFARLGDVLWVHTQAQKLGRVQILLRQRIYILPTQQPINPLPQQPARDMLQEKHCIFDALVRMGYVNVATQQPAQIPQSFANILTTLLPNS